ncbi:PREDICTED: acid-sensing ion channel 1-like [Tinamus guttatus]|nr:PREDICTED: acid-sensing ion channel 1-like [Tinamus guttatus]
MMDLKAEEEEASGGRPVSLQAFASSSTLHGLAHIFSYERLSVKRAVWALCFLGSLALLALVCTNRIQYYFLYPHVTKLDEVAATHLTFPAVTLCNLNEFRFSRVTKNDLYHAGELLALLNNRYEIPDTQAADERQLEILQDKANFRNFKPKPFNMLEFYDRAGHDIREMLLSCFFRGEKCSPEDFKVVSTRHSATGSRGCSHRALQLPEGREFVGNPHSEREARSEVCKERQNRSGARRDTVLAAPWAACPGSGRPAGSPESRWMQKSPALREERPGQPGSTRTDAPRGTAPASTCPRPQNRPSLLLSPCS